MTRIAPSTHGRKTRQLVLLVVVILGGVLALARPAAARPLAAAGPEAHMLDLVNGERAAVGLPPLAWRDDVAAIAEGWSAYMASTGDFRHNDAYFSEATRQAIGSETRGENVSTAGSIDSSHTNLMNSPPHRANILSPEYTHIGIGAVQDASGRWWVTQGFMRPSGAQPAPAPEPEPEPAPAAPEPAPEPPPPPAPAPAPEPAPVVAAPAPAPEPAPVAEAPTTVAPPVEPALTGLVAADPVLHDLAAAPAAPQGSTEQVPALFAIGASLVAAAVLAGHLVVASRGRERRSPALRLPLLAPAAS